MKSLSLIGMSKNSGKTTVLNALLEFYSKRGIKLALSSVGRDGEDEDILTSTGKPKIFVDEGTLFATVSSLLPLCDITKEILSVPGINTPLGEVIIMRARSGGYIQLAGPSVNSQTSNVCSILESFGADIILVDGAISRKTFSSPSITDATILCTGAALSANMNRVIDDTVHVHDLLKSPKIDSELRQKSEGSSLALIRDDGSCEGFEQAALTDSLAEDIIKRGVQNSIIIADDASKFLIRRDTVNKLKFRNNSLMVRNSIKLLAVTINPVSGSSYEFDSKLFKKALKQYIDTPVINVMERREELYDLLG
ncbi:MAG: hypothetical protein FWG77_11415 [Treponema sp.]|nr:hypothetical protein [Treponema sp.]